MAQFVHNSWPNETTRKMPFDLIMGYVPRARIKRFTSNHSPTVNQRLKDVQEARNQAQEAMTRAQDQWKKGRDPKKDFTPYETGQKVWLNAKNLKTSHPFTKLVPKRYGPFEIIKKLSDVAYQL